MSDSNVGKAKYTNVMLKELEIGTTCCYAEIAPGHVYQFMRIFVGLIWSVKCPAVKGPFRSMQYWVSYVYKSTNTFPLSFGRCYRQQMTLIFTHFPHLNNF